MRKTITVLALVLAIVLMAVPVSAAATNPTVFFANTKLEVYNWSTPAVYMAYNGFLGQTQYYDVDANVVGAITWGMVDYANGGFEFTEDGTIKAFNEYRGVSHLGVMLPDWTKYEQEPAGTTASAPSQADVTRYRQQVIDMVNEQRVAAGLNELEAHGALMDFAQIRAEELTTSYSHVRPDGTRGNETTAYLVTGSQRACAENIALGNKDPSAVMSAWMGSTGHRENILSDNRNYIGIGCYEKDGKLHWVQLFSR